MLRCKITIAAELTPITPADATQRHYGVILCEDTCHVRTRESGPALSVTRVYGTVRFASRTVPVGFVVNKVAFVLVFFGVALC